MLRLESLDIGRLPHSSKGGRLRFLIRAAHLPSHVLKLQRVVLVNIVRFLSPDHEADRVRDNDSCHPRRVGLEEQIHIYIVER